MLVCHGYAFLLTLGMQVIALKTVDLYPSF